jgi:type IV secretory pathway VirB2 component (pilin)
MKKVGLFSFFTFLFLTLGFAAFAGSNDGTMTGMLCGGYKVFSGTIGKMLAVFAIVALGVGLFMGKVTWGLVFAVALGIGAIFGAQSIVGLITGGGGQICSGVSGSDRA